jgi:hypothetical protein
VYYIWNNIFRINKALTNGFMIGNEGVLIELTKGETKHEFKQRLKNKGVFVSGVKMVNLLNQAANKVFGTKN